jgi:hypothetical protein
MSAGSQNRRSKRNGFVRPAARSGPMSSIEQSNHGLRAKSAPGKGLSGARDAESHLGKGLSGAKNAESPTVSKRPERRGRANASLERFAQNASNPCNQRRLLRKTRLIQKAFPAPETRNPQRARACLAPETRNR